MILCVSPNAAIDRTLTVSGYGRGGIFRPESTLIAAGGKGVNVARAVRALGGDSMCMGFIAGHSGNFLLDMLEEEGQASDFTILATGETRTCLILIDPALPEPTVINEHGPTVNAGDWARLRDALLMRDAPTVCFSGSVPPGTSMESFRDTVQACIEDGRAVWVDSSGAALETALQIPYAQIKVNAHEISAAWGRPVRRITEVLDAADFVRGHTHSAVAVTLGAQGAVLVTDAGTWHAVTPPVMVKNAVGSGDSFLAGLALAHARGTSAPESLRLAVAAGAVNAQTKGGGHFQGDAVLHLAAQTQVKRLR